MQKIRCGFLWQILIKAEPKCLIKIGFTFLTALFTSTKLAFLIVMATALFTASSVTWLVLTEEVGWLVEDGPSDVVGKISDAKIKYLFNTYIYNKERKKLNLSQATLNCCWFHFSDFSYENLVVHQGNILAADHLVNSRNPPTKFWYHKEKLDVEQMTNNLLILLCLWFASYYLLKLNL